MKRTPRQRNTPQVGLDHSDEWLGGEPAPKPASQRRIQFDRDDTGSGIGERRGERAVPRAEIENKVALASAAGPD